MEEEDGRTREGKVCVVTGATGGIGGAAAAGLARRGATVVLLCRSREKGEAARQAMGPAAHVVLADLASQAQVRAAAAEITKRWPKVHVLVNNAATYHGRRRLTEDGIERQWAVNHLAPFLLTSLLVPRLRAGAPSRVVTVSSNAHTDIREVPWDDLQMARGRYRGFRQYGVTKLANVLFTRELARREAAHGVTANAMHPGVVATELLLNGFPPLRLVQRFLRTPEEGARTAVWLASSPEVAGVTGKYWIDERPVDPSPAARDDAAARRLWEISEEMTGLAAG